MNLDLLKDDAIWIIGAAISLWEITNRIVKKKSVWGIITFIVALTIFVWLGLNQAKRNSVTQQKYEKDVNELKQHISGLEGELRANDSIQEKNHKNDVEFQNKLTAEFKIGRDSTSNKPYPISSTYNTNIGKAKNVHIGPGN